MFHTSHMVDLSGCISRACVTRHTDICNYDGRDLTKHPHTTTASVEHTSRSLIEQVYLYVAKELTHSVDRHAVCQHNIQYCRCRRSMFLCRLDADRYKYRHKYDKDESGRHDRVTPGSPTHVTVRVAIEIVHSFLTRRELPGSNTVCQQVNWHRDTMSPRTQCNVSVWSA